MHNPQAPQSESSNRVGRNPFRKGAVLKTTATQESRNTLESEQPRPPRELKKDPKESTFVPITPALPEVARAAFRVACVYGPEWVALEALSWVLNRRSLSG